MSSNLLKYRDVRVLRICDFLCGAGFGENHTKIRQGGEFAAACDPPQPQAPPARFRPMVRRAVMKSCLATANQAGSCAFNAQGCVLVAEHET